MAYEFIGIKLKSSFSFKLLVVWDGCSLFPDLILVFKQGPQVSKICMKMLSTRTRMNEKLKMLSTFDMCQNYIEIKKT
jgi:hypothetical protein